MSKLRVLALAFPGLALTASLALAQVSSGKFEGKVTDNQRKVLAGVTVEATNPKLAGKASTVTDASGAYRLFGLPSGSYEITFSLQGFKRVVRKDVVVELSQTVNLNVTLEPAAFEEQATGVWMSPLIDVKSTVKSSTITKDVFMSLPRNRDFDGLLSTVPGVQYNGNTGGLSVDGATGSENIWSVDGADISHVHTGIRAQAAVLDLIEEVNVKASGYDAQYGGSLGGVINVITRSGGNSFHGEIIGYYENNELWMQGKSRDYLRQDPFDDQRYEYVNDDDLLFNGGKDRDPRYRLEGVFNLGGYIIKNRLWFFGSFNPVYGQTKARRYFLSDPEPRPKSEYFNKNWGLNGSVKVTAALFSGLRISASWVNNFSRYRGSIPSIYATSAKTYEYAKEGFDYPNWSGAATIDYSISNSVLLSLRGGWAGQDMRNQQIALPETRYDFGRGNNIYTSDPNLLRYRGWTNWPSSVLETKKRLYEKISGNLDLTFYFNLAGEHAWKVGAQYMQLHEDVDNMAAHPLVTLNWGIPYLGLASGEPVMGKYGHYQVRNSWTSPYGYLWNIYSNRWAIYLQDSWTIGGKLTLNLGIRAESEDIPAFTNEPQQPGYQDKPIQFNFKDKLAPRLGVIYDVFGDSSLKVFGSLGIYYDVMKLYMAEGAYGGFKWRTDYYELNTLDWTVIASSGIIDDRASQEAGGRYVGTMDWRMPSWGTTDPDLKPVSQREISFGFEKKMMENLALSLRLAQKHLIRTIEDIGVLTPSGEQYYIANPGYGWSLPVSQGGKFDDKYWPTPKAKREYYGLNISLEKRFSNNWQGGINYTLSRVEGNYGGLSSPDEGGRNSPNVERYFDLWFMAYDLKGNKIDGPLPQDRTHYIKAYGSYAFPFGLTIGIVGYGRSGQPLSTKLNANNTYIYPNNYANLGRMPFTLWADIYVEYSLKFGRTCAASLNLQVNNFTNTKTWQAINTAPNRVSMPISTDEILSKSFEYRARLPECDPDPSFFMETSRFGPWSARVGAKFSF